jgi:hypothetical protein
MIIIETIIADTKPTFSSLLLKNMPTNDIICFEWLFKSSNIVHHHHQTNLVAEREAEMQRRVAPVFRPLSEVAATNPAEVEAGRAEEGVMRKFRKQRFKQCWLNDGEMINSCWIVLSV